MSPSPPGLSYIPISIPRVLCVHFHRLYFLFSCLITWLVLHIVALFLFYRFTVYSATTLCTATLVVMTLCHTNTLIVCPSLRLMSVDEFVDFCRCSLLKNHYNLGFESQRTSASQRAIQQVLDNKVGIRGNVIDKTSIQG